MRDDTDSIVQSIYAAAVTPVLWPETLDQIMRAFDSRFAGHITQTIDREQHRGIAAGIDDIEYQAFLSRWHHGNPFGRRAPMTVMGEILSTSRVMPRDELVRTPMFGEFLDPHGMHHGLRLAIWRGPRTASGLSLMRPFAKGDYEPHEIALAQRLMPHLQRATAVMRHLRSADLAMQTMTQALDALRQPVLLLDCDGRLSHANPPAWLVLRQADGLDLSPAGLLRVPGGAFGNRLDAMLGRAAVGPAKGRRAGVLRLPRPSGARHLAMVAMPLAAGSVWDDDLPARPVTLVCIADPAVGARLSPALLTDLFGLTPAEAALASDLLDGSDLSTIAARSGRSLNTLRTQLSGVMAKTGTKRQFELARTLATLPTV